jgi:hypothetical protein
LLILGILLIGINAAYVYSSTSTASLDFSLVVKLSPQEDSKVLNVDGYGSAISSDYETLAIGAPYTLLANYTRSNGAVYMYELSNDNGSNDITNIQVITPNVLSLISWMEAKSYYHSTFTFGEFIYFNDEIGLITGSKINIYHILVYY